jgi:hypothetical protein
MGRSRLRAGKRPGPYPAADRPDWEASIREGRWRDSGALPVEIPASYGRERRAVCYMVRELVSNYYDVITRSDGMPVLIDHQI